MAQRLVPACSDLASPRLLAADRGAPSVCQLQTATPPTDPTLFTLLNDPNEVAIAHPSVQLPHLSRRREVTPGLGLLGRQTDRDLERTEGSAHFGAGRYRVLDGLAM